MATAAIATTTTTAAAIDEPSAIDDAIFRRPIPAQRSDAEWQAIVDHLSASLGQLLAAELDIVDFSVVDAVALSCAIQSRNSICGPLDVRFKGLIVFEAIDDAPYVNALLFLYSLGRRLAVEGDTSSLIECVYARDEDYLGCWSFKGWSKDEYEEFRGFAPRLHATSPNAP